MLSIRKQINLVKHLSILPIDKPVISTACRDVMLVSSTTHGFQAEANCPKSRFFSLLGLGIGTYMVGCNMLYTIMETYIWKINIFN